MHQRASRINDGPDWNTLRPIATALQAVLGSQRHQKGLCRFAERYAGHDARSTSPSLAKRIASLPKKTTAAFGSIAITAEIRNT
jgi:hypothetical protein